MLRQICKFLKDIPIFMLDVPYLNSVMTLKIQDSRSNQMLIIIIIVASYIAPINIHSLGTLQIIHT